MRLCTRMKAEYINPFVKAAYEVVQATLGVRPEKGELSVRTDGTTCQQCTTVTGVTGRLSGAVTFGMTLATADRIASMMLGQPVVTFDQLAASAIAELANMIAGHALTELAERGYVCDISPPSIVRGANIRVMPMGNKSIVIPLLVEGAEIELCLSLKEPGAQ